MRMFSCVSHAFVAVLIGGGSLDAVAQFSQTTGASSGKSGEERVDVAAASPRDFDFILGR